jgi:hypothetical protein
MRMVAVAACAAVAAAGCSSGSEPEPRLDAAPARNIARPDACPVTLPNGSTPPGARDWATDHSYGNGKLFTEFWPFGVVVAHPVQVNADGAIEMKWPWWRGNRGHLRVEGRRLDGEAPPLRAEIPPYYGLVGFQPSGLVFPSEGCWEVTGRVGDAALTFVMIVVEGSRYRE